MRRFAGFRHGNGIYEAPLIEMVPVAIAASLRFLSGIDMKIRKFVRQNADHIRKLPVVAGEDQDWRRKSLGFLPVAAIKA
jgi:hypothetical protein